MTVIYNQIADFAVNHTMDIGRSWHKRFSVPIPRLKAKQANWICYSDGGTRKNSCSGSAWFLEAVVIQGDLKHRFPIAMAGIYMSVPVSPFLAEAIALDEATSFYYKFIAESTNRSRKRALSE